MCSLDENGRQFKPTKVTLHLFISILVKMLEQASSPQGGVSDEVTLSAYITATFLEMKISVNVSRGWALHSHFLKLIIK